MTVRQMPLRTALMAPGHVEAEDQLELGDGSYKIALVNPARLVVDV